MKGRETEREKEGKIGGHWRLGGQETNGRDMKELGKELRGGKKKKKKRGTMKGKRGILQSTAGANNK